MILSTVEGDIVRVLVRETKGSSQDRVHSSRSTVAAVLVVLLVGVVAPLSADTPPGSMLFFRMSRSDIERMRLLGGRWPAT